MSDEDISIDSPNHHHQANRKNITLGLSANRIECLRSAP